MKSLRNILLLWIVLFSISCHQKPPASSKNVENQQGKLKDTLPRYTAEMVVNKKDFVCGMPVKAGIEDTAHVNGKAYGFCSKECKDAFLKNPTAYIAANQ